MAKLERNLSLTHRVVDALGSSIVGEGERNIPPESALCEQYGVSRSAIREAVKMLASKGLVYSRPRLGITVSPASDWNIFDPDVLRWMFNNGPTLEILQQFLQFRLDMEPGAAELATKNASDDQIEQISRALDSMKAAGDDSEKHLGADIDFHISILEATNNPFYVSLKTFIREALRASISYTSAKVKDFDMVIKEHAAIYNAIKNGKPQAARKGMAKLVKEALEKVEKKLA